MGYDQDSNAKKLKTLKKGILTLLFRIIRAWRYYFAGKNRELMKSRLSICHDCELRKWKVCGECGCPLFAKASDPEEHCPHPKMDKWIYIDQYYKMHPLKTETFETRSDL